MDKQELLDTLRTLHDELSETERIDDETRQLLHDVTDDIHRVLDNDSETTATDKPVSSRLQELLVKFEIEHPKIGGLIERLSDALANMGI